MKVLLLAGAAPALLALAAVTAGSAAGPATLLAAHRGGAALWPENSLDAFRGAVALGADFIEFDVHLSKDGEVVVIHDPTLERTTTGSGAVGELTLAGLRALRLKDRSGAVTGLGVPTLDEVAAVAAEGRRRMLLEIKVDAAKARYPGIEEKVLAVLDRHGMAGSTIVMAFEAATWRRVREIRPGIAVGALHSRRTLRGSALGAEIESLRGAGVGMIGLEQSLVDADAVAEARRAGLELAAWTVNDKAAMKRMIALGVGILITDQPDLARTLLGPGTLPGR